MHNICLFKPTNQATKLKDERMTSATYIEGSQQAHQNGGTAIKKNEIVEIVID